MKKSWNRFHRFFTIFPQKFVVFSRIFLFKPPTVVFAIHSMNNAYRYGVGNSILFMLILNVKLFFKLHIHSKIQQIKLNPLLLGLCYLIKSNGSIIFFVYVAKSGKLWISTSCTFASCWAGYIYRSVFLVFHWVIACNPGGILAILFARRYCTSDFGGFIRYNLGKFSHRSKKYSK